jgi:hypothetical protein
MRGVQNELGEKDLVFAFVNLWLLAVCWVDVWALLAMNLHILGVCCCLFDFWYTCITYRK